LTWLKMNPNTNNLDNEQDPNNVFKIGK
jgi:hypothetical protein